MRYGNIVSDWNGTLTSSTEEASNKNLGYRMKDDTLKDVSHGQVWKIPRLLKLLGAKTATEKALAAYKRGEVPLRDVYEPFNSAIEGVPVSYIDAVVADFARRTADQVDKRVMKPIATMHRWGAKTGILSVAYCGVIFRTLVEAYYSGFDIIVANDLESRDGKATGFTLNIYGEKARAMENIFFRQNGFVPEQTIYLGNDPVDDGPVAELLPPGHFIVPFLATDDARQVLASQRKAFVPASEEDLQRYLQEKLRF